MNYCHVEFTPANTDALARTQKILTLMQSMKAGETQGDETVITALLTPGEKAYFWNPSAEELAQWNTHWQNTSVAVRTSPAMICPQWDMESMYWAIQDAELYLVGIIEEDGTYFLAFNPHAYPYGGISSLIAFLECFGHKVLGYDDGTGYFSYHPRQLWQSGQVSGC